MSNANLQLWSDSPYSRLRAAQKYSRLGKKFAKQIIAKAPGGKWPYGMPTSVNPWLLVMGISPGGGEHKGDDGLPPTIGEVHSGFGGKYGKWDQPPNSPSPFWLKIRELCFGLIKNADSRMNREEDCLAVSGLLNLGIKNEGQGTLDATDSRIVKWVPQALEMLKPRIIVLLGWKGFLRNLPKTWKKNSFMKTLMASTHEDFPLRIENKDHMFWVWRTPMSWGNVLVICWPNHPRKPPFSNKKHWEKSIKQASLLLKKRK